MTDGPKSPAARQVLVTGGAGFIGSHLVDALIGRGVAVRVIDNFATGRREFLNLGAELIEADIRQPESIESAFDDIDCVFHVAALPRVMLSIDRPVETHLTNVVGTLNVLNAARARGVRRVIYSGSSSVYGDQATLPMVETMTPNPLNPYALQKSVGEQYCRMFYRLHGLETLTLRYFNVYGPRMALEGAYATVMSAFIRARREGRPLTIYGDGEQTRDFTHASDVVRANLAALAAPVADGRALNVGRGRSITVNQVAEIFGGERIYLPARAGEMRDTLADLTAVMKALQWRPEVATADGIRALIRDAGLAS